MFLAAKYEEMYPPEIGDFTFVTDHTYTKAQIREMEMKILRALNFAMGRPLPLHFLRRASKIGEVIGVIWVALSVHWRWEIAGWGCFVFSVVELVIPMSSHHFKTFLNGLH